MESSSATDNHVIKELRRGYKLKDRLPRPGMVVVARNSGGIQEDHSNTDQNQASSKSGEMAGNVSSNGKTFTNDKDSKDYKVDNPDARKGHEGQHVAIIVHVDPDTGVIHIMQVEAPPQP